MPGSKSILPALALLVFLLTACNGPALNSAPLSAVSFNGSTPLAPLYQVPPNATPTATPFQPLPPTPVYQPLEFPTATPLATPVEQPQGPVAPVGRLEGPNDQVNILLLGSDARPRSTIFRTDTIILVSLNPSLGTVNMVSFPRDLYVNIPGWGMDRINTAWARGGFSKLAATFDHNFGVEPEHYVLINFSSFKQIIDSLGGLNVDVGTPLTDYYRGRQITLSRGETRMNADMVLWYVRSRKTSNDFARNRRQQEVIQALAAKLLSLDAIRRAPELYAIYSDSVSTDMRLADMLPFLPLAAQLYDTSRINQYYISPKEVYNWITPGGAMVLVPDKDAVVKVVRKALSGK
ncbi:MAG: LCP family protein [Anaerolineales bacterium]|nr:MAG: LCP family protein [Anaerolineales bacterium]